MVKAGPAGRLSRERWAEAALAALAGGGVEAVAVEPIAQKLGATKGSFYWHFRDRAELLAVALDHWEVIATRAVIDQLASVIDAQERLRRLLEVAFRDADEDRLEAAVFAAADHPLVHPVVERVTGARLEYLEEIFVALGFDPVVARARARIAYAAYLGHVQPRVIDGRAEQSVRAVRRYVGELMRVLVAPNEPS